MSSASSSSLSSSSAVPDAQDLSRSESGGLVFDYAALARAAERDELRRLAAQPAHALLSMGQDPVADLSAPHQVRSGESSSSSSDSDPSDAAPRRKKQRRSKKGGSAPRAKTPKSRSFFVTLFWSTVEEKKYYEVRLADLRDKTSQMRTCIEWCPSTGRRHMHVAYTYGRNGGSRTFNQEVKVWRLPWRLGSQNAANTLDPELFKKPNPGDGGAPEQYAQTADITRAIRKERENAKANMADVGKNYMKKISADGEEWRQSCNVQFARNPRASRLYCGKHMLLSEFCVTGPGQGSRQDLDAFYASCRQLMEGEIAYASLWRSHLPQMMKYHKAAAQMVNDTAAPRKDNTHCLVIYGPPDCGKTSFVKAMFEGAYDMLQYNSRSNFFVMPKQNTGNLIAVFDDPDVNSWKSKTVKQLLNHTEVSCNIKGSDRNFNYSLVIITCNERPHNDEWDDAVKQRFGLLRNGHRGSLVEWPECDDATRATVTVPQFLADECHSCRFIRGVGCYSGRAVGAATDSEFTTCICAQQYRTHEYNGTSVCEGVFRQLSFGPGRAFVIPRQSVAPALNPVAGLMARRRAVAHEQQQQEEQSESELSHVSESEIDDSPSEPLFIPPAVLDASEGESDDDGLLSDHADDSVSESEFADRCEVRRAKRRRR
jgi:hypothetical protein